MSFLKSFPPPSPEDGLRQQQPDTEAVLDGKGLGTGTLYIAESRLSWLDGSGIGFSLDYPTISLHAVSRDLNAYPQEHLYVMVNARFGEEEPKELKETAMAEGEEDEDSDEDVEPIAEFRFVPSDKSAYPEDEDSDDYDGEEYDVEAHEGQATLERLEGMLAQSVSSQYNMAGVRTEDSVRDYEDGMEIDTTPTVAGQFEDADVDH
ncbi:methylosome subunit pICln isoform X4 [Notamacropus eugenii]|uniref:methylosome subunit pICln isoform X4 n=1 Tax=Notamacropus eugenii TaxID=9315 RepID=UPI003B67AD42